MCSTSFCVLCRFVRFRPGSACQPTHAGVGHSGNHAWGQGAITQHEAPEGTPQKLRYQNAEGSALSIKKRSQRASLQKDTLKAFGQAAKGCKSIRWQSFNKDLERQPGSLRSAPGSATRCLGHKAGLGVCVFSGSVHVRTEKHACLCVHMDCCSAHRRSPQAEAGGPDRANIRSSSDTGGGFRNYWVLGVLVLQESCYLGVYIGGPLLS